MKELSVQETQAVAGGVSAYQTFLGNAMLKVAVATKSQSLAKAALLMLGGYH